VFAPRVDRLGTHAVFLRTSETDFSSASRRIVIIWPSVNRGFFMAPQWPEGALLSSFRWSENRRTGHGRHAQPPDTAITRGRADCLPGRPPVEPRVALLYVNGPRTGRVHLGRTLRFARGFVTLAAHQEAVKKMLAKPLAVLVTALSLMPADATTQDYTPQVSEMATAISKSMAANAKRSVAILDLTDLNGNPMCLGQLLAEELSVALVSAGQGIEVVSRNDVKLKAVLKEQKLGTTGAIDPQTAVKVGQLVGVQTLVTGTISPIGDRVRLTLTLLDSGSARIIGGAATQLPRTKAIEEYLGSCGGAAASDATPNAGASAPSSPRATVQTLASAGIVFDLKGCQAMAGDLTCDLTATSRGQDRTFGFWEVRAFDSQGTQYESQGIMLAGEPIPFQAPLITDVVTPIRIRLGTRASAIMNGAAKAASSPPLKFSLLRIHGWASTGHETGVAPELNLQFRDVAIRSR
jgi:TolB-like protein